MIKIQIFSIKMTQSIPNPYLVHTKWFSFTTKMQHPTDEDYESDETMELELETDSESDDGSAADEASDDGSAADEASDDGSAADEAAELKQRQIDWYDQAIRNISEIALPIIKNKEWDRLREIDSYWEPPGMPRFAWPGNHVLNHMIQAWEGWDDEGEEGKPSEAPTQEQIALLLASLTKMQQRFAQRFAYLHGNQNFVLLP